MPVRFYLLLVAGSAVAGSVWFALDNPGFWTLKWIATLLFVVVIAARNFLLCGKSQHPA